MDERQPDRRRRPSEVRTRPRPSPVTFLIVVVAGVLAATTATAALLGTGFEETTPHGQVLTALRSVAEAQEEHYQRTGTFAQRLHTLDTESRGEVRIELVRADREGWEAIASHPVGLTCVQAGKADRGQTRREQPLCYTSGGD